MLLNFFSSLADEVAVYLIAMLPGMEVKVAIPVAVLKFNMPYWQAFLLASLGNFIMGGLFFLLFSYLVKVLTKKIKLLDKGWKKTIGKVKEKNLKLFKAGEASLLVLLMIIPIPGFGVFLASILGAILKTDIKFFLVYALAGIITSGALVTSLIISLNL